MSRTLGVVLVGYILGKIIDYITNKVSSKLEDFKNGYIASLTLKNDNPF